VPLAAMCRGGLVRVEDPMGSLERPGASKAILCWAGGLPPGVKSGRRECGLK
jgi:hypothetical protein